MRHDKRDAPRTAGRLPGWPGRPDQPRVSGHRHAGRWQDRGRIASQIEIPKLPPLRPDGPAIREAQTGGRGRPDRAGARRREPALRSPLPRFPRSPQPQNREPTRLEVRSESSSAATSRTRRRARGIRAPGYSCRVRIPRPRRPHRTRRRAECRGQAPAGGYLGHSRGTHRIAYGECLLTRGRCPGALAMPVRAKGRALPEAGSSGW